MEINNGTREILIICENDLEEKKLKDQIIRKSNCCVVSSGRKALNVIRHYSGFSDIFIPLDLSDMDYSDFIKFSKRYSPDSNYILISTPALPDLGWLVQSREIDGYIQEPLSVGKISKFVKSFKNPHKSHLVEKELSGWRPGFYFSGTSFSRA